MKKKRTAKVHVSKRTALESIFLRHNQKTHPITRETFMVIVTLCFRVIEEIWTSVDAREAFRTISSDPNHAVPAPVEEEFMVQRQKRARSGRWKRPKA